MPNLSFEQLNLINQLQRTLADLGHTSPTPIQTQAIPYLLEGKDLWGCAQTGTGKTAAFALPVLQRLETIRRPLGPRETRVLVLAPTRELAMQISESFRTYGRGLRFRLAVVFGGVSPMPQIRACARGLDVLVATPGRLLDLMNQGRISLSRVDTLILDEADHMLDMGFLPDIKKIMGHIPRERQTMMFSATMPQAIARLAESILHEPVKVSVAPAATPVDKIAQRVLFVSQDDKRALLDHLLNDAEAKRVLVFTRTKHSADRLAKALYKNRVNADAIHGNKSQQARQSALYKFKNGGTRVLVATDVAARGLDVEGVTHVINFDLPKDPESYVHRIGRTGRAGAVGEAISFCDNCERSSLRNIERLIRANVPVDGDHPFPQEAPAYRRPSKPFARRDNRGYRPRGGDKRAAAGARA